MTYKIGNQGEDRNRQALIGYVQAQTAGKDSGLGVPGPPAHNVRLCPLQSQGQGREAVGNQIDPQQMHRLENGKAQQRCGKDADDLAHIGAQEELNGLADVVVNPTALLYSPHNGGKIVIRQDHIRHIFGHVRTGDPHTHANVCGLDGGRVVDAVASHRRD